MFRPLFSGAIALTFLSALCSSALATPLPQRIAQRDPRDPAGRRDDPSLIEEGGTEELEDSLEDNDPVTFAVRLNTELFVNSGDLVEFLVPIRYNPSDRLALEAVPVIKYFPESSEEEFDYGIKFAVEYQL